MKSRRDFFVSTIKMGSVVGLVPFARALALTPQQTEGPFHPVNLDADLTRKRSGGPLADGEIIYIQGQVTDEQNLPLSGAVIEIWQAGANGRYNHAADPSPLPIDPNFQYFGRAITNAQGRYQFKTILPGSYPAAADWTRPAHIHFRIMRRGFHDLTTQLYFKAKNAAEQKLLDRDAILQALSPADQAKVVVPLVPAPSSGNFESDSQVCLFKIELEKVQR